MTRVGTHEAVAGYLAALRAALADLPPAEVEEILDDVGPHLAEVAAELDGSTSGTSGTAGTGGSEAGGGATTGDDLPRRLRERLGEPEEYAAELRAAAGYPPRAPAVGRSAPDLSGPRLAFWLLVAATGLVFLLTVALVNGSAAGGVLLLLTAGLAAASLTLATRSPDGVSALGQLPEVRWLRSRQPRGAAAEYVGVLHTGWWLLRAGIAALLFAALVGLDYLLVGLLFVPFALGSVWVGRRSRADRRWLWAVLPLNAFAVVVGLFLLGRLAGPFGPSAYVDHPSPAGIQQVAPFGNIYPFDSSGRPLTGVYLYDENGQPITAGYRNSCIPTDGVPVPANQYPQPVYDIDANGQCVPRSATPVPPQLPSASAAPTPGASAPVPTTPALPQPPPTR